MALFLAPIGGGGAVILLCCVAYAVRSHSNRDKDHEEESDVDSIGSETLALAPPTVVYGLAVAAVNPGYRDSASHDSASDPGYLAVPEEEELQVTQHTVVQYAHQAGHQPQQYVGQINQVREPPAVPPQ